MSTERVIIQRGAADAFVQELSALFKQIKAGDFQNDPSAMLGALFTEVSAENVIRLLTDAVRKGARIVVGDMQRQGTVVQPHIIMDVKPGMEIWDRETFGPGACSCRACRMVAFEFAVASRNRRSGGHGGRSSGVGELLRLLIDVGTLDEGRLQGLWGDGAHPCWYVSPN